MFVVVFDYMDSSVEAGDYKVAWSCKEMFAKKSELNRFMRNHRERAKHESGVYGMCNWAKVDEFDIDLKLFTFYAMSAPDLHIRLEDLTREALGDAKKYVKDCERKHNEKWEREFGVQA